jgi:Thiol:disulfide interchange protein DsbD, N-terminal
MKFAASALLLLASCLAAQAPGTVQPSVQMAPVEEVHLRPGQTAKVLLDFRVDANFHINSNKPKSNLLIPTSLQLVAPKPLEIAAIQYPPGEDQTFPFSPNEKLSVYSGDFELVALLKAPSSATASRYHVAGELSYQACDRNACYPPKKMPVEFDVRVR